VIEENPDLLQKKIAQTLSLHRDIAKRLSTEELNLGRVNFKAVPHTLTTSQKWERVKISPKLFGRLNDLARVITVFCLFSILRDCINISAAAS
jgi:hypothetical protein